MWLEAFELAAGYLFSDDKLVKRTLRQSNCSLLCHVQIYADLFVIFQLHDNEWIASLALS
jgi:hypothetical protein